MLKVAAFMSCLILIKTEPFNHQENDCEEKIGNICLLDNSYPYEEIDRLMKAKQVPSINHFNNNNLTFGSVVKSNNCSYCPTSVCTQIYPISLLESGKKLHIIGTKTYPRPLVNIQICKKHGKCRNPSLVNGYDSYCVQRRSQLKVLVYNPTSKKFEGRTLTYPSHCQCVLRENTDI